MPGGMGKGSNNENIWLGNVENGRILNAENDWWLTWHVGSLARLVGANTSGRVLLLRGIHRLSRRNKMDRNTKATGLATFDAERTDRGLAY